MTTPRVTVPVEPTESMKIAGVHAIDNVQPNDVSMWVTACWSAMLSSAPAPEGGAVPYDLSDLCQEVRRRYPSAFDGTDPISTHPPSLENATDLFLACCLAALASSGDQLSGNPRQLKSGDHAELARLAEADRLINRAADLMRQCTDPDRFEGASTLNVYANMRAWLSDLSKEAERG